MEEGEHGGIYTFRYSVTTGMTPASRWATKREPLSLLIFSFINCEGQSHKTVSTNHNLFEEKGSRSGIEPRSFC